MGSGSLQNQMLKDRSSKSVGVNHGIKLRLTTGDLISNYIYQLQEQERNRYLIRNLNDLNERSFVDIGANIGYFSIFGSQEQSELQSLQLQTNPFHLQATQRESSAE